MILQTCFQSKSGGTVSAAEQEFVSLTLQRMACFKSIDPPSTGQLQLAESIGRNVPSGVDKAGCMLLRRASSCTGRGRGGLHVRHIGAHPPPPSGGRISWPGAYFLAWGMV